jgi:hypothetical protein
MQYHISWRKLDELRNALQGYERKLGQTETGEIIL